MTTGLLIVCVGAFLGSLVPANTSPSLIWSIGLVTGLLAGEF